MEIAIDFILSLAILFRLIELIFAQKKRMPNVSESHSVYLCNTDMFQILFGAYIFY